MGLDWTKMGWRGVDLDSGKHRNEMPWRGQIWCVDRWEMGCYESLKLLDLNWENPTLVWRRQEECESWRLLWSIHLQLWNGVAADEKWLEETWATDANETWIPLINAPAAAKKLASNAWISWTQMKWRQSKLKSIVKLCLLKNIDSKLLCSFKVSAYYRPRWHLRNGLGRIEKSCFEMGFLRSDSRFRNMNLDASNAWNTCLACIPQRLKHRKELLQQTEEEYFD